MATRNKQKEMNKPSMARAAADELGITTPAAADGKRLSDEEIYRLIQQSAYYKARARGFAPGHEVEDWIAAEREVKGSLKRSPM